MRDTPNAIMLFAAGFGTRMRHLTKDQPKPMVPVAGRPLIDHALDLVEGVKIDRTVANLHYKPQILRDHLATRDITLIEETPDILETGGGLKNALPTLGNDPVFTMNTDAVWRGANPLNQLCAAWQPDKMDALLILIPLAFAVGYSGQGDFQLDPNGRLCRGPGMIYGGAQILKTDRLEKIPERAFSLNLIWNEMQADGRLFGVPYDGSWCDVGHPEGIPLAEEMLAAPDV